MNTQEEDQDEKFAKITQELDCLKAGIGEEFIAMLPLSVRARLMKNYQKIYNKNQIYHINTGLILDISVLMNGFLPWSDTEEGGSYWLKVYSHYNNRVWRMHTIVNKYRRIKGEPIYIERGNFIDAVKLGEIEYTD
jgi:hypothetical protein